MTCEHCEVLDGGCAFPYYGVAPHNCGPYDQVGTATALPKNEWPDNFVEDPECPTEDGKLGCGIYTHCPECGAPDSEGHNQ